MSRTLPGQRVYGRRAAANSNPFITSQVSYGVGEAINRNPGPASKHPLQTGISAQFQFPFTRGAMNDTVTGTNIVLEVELGETLIRNTLLIKFGEEECLCSQT